MKEKKTINVWIIIAAFALVIIGIIAFAVIRLWIWDKSGNVVLEDIPEGTYDFESYDYIFTVDPTVISEHDAKYGNDDVENILCIGDYVLTLTNEDGVCLADYLSGMEGFDVTVLCAGESSVADVQNAYESNDVTDWQAGNLYDVVYALCNNDYSLQKESMDAGHGIRPDYYETLCKVDMNRIDTIFIMYSSVDYVKASVLYDPEDNFNTATYEGALRASLKTLQNTYPHLKIVFSSPYLHGVIEDEDFIPATMKNYGNGNLSEYIMRCYNISMECCVSFADNYFGLINEDNINDYCYLNILNKDGMELIGGHITDFLKRKY